MRNLVVIVTWSLTKLNKKKKRKKERKKEAGE